MYTKGEFCKASGIDRETLRYYLKEGLLKPAQTLENGYNLYSKTDVIKALDIRYHRGYGISLSEISGTMDHPEKETYAEWINGQCELMRQDVEARRQLLERMEADARWLADSSEAPATPYLTVGDAGYMSAYYDGSDASAVRIRRLSSFFPFSAVSLRFPKAAAIEWLETGQDSDVFDVGVSLRDFQNVSKEDPEGYIVAPKQRLYCRLEVPDLEHLTVATFSPLLECVKQHSFTMTSDLICAVLGISHGDDGTVAALVSPNVGIEL